MKSAMETLADLGSSNVFMSGFASSDQNEAIQSWAAGQVAMLYNGCLLYTSCGFPGFLSSIFQNRPTVDGQPPKEQKQKKTAFLLLLRKAFFHFLDTGREMIFDCPSGLSWGLTGEGGNSFLPAAGTEETIKQPSFSSMETDIFPI